MSQNILKIIIKNTVLFTLLACILSASNLFEYTSNTVSANTVSYTESNVNIPNPERGFFTQGDYTDVNYLQNLKSQQSITVYRNIYRINDYVNSPLPQSFLDKLYADAEIFRQLGYKQWVNFQYSKDPNASPVDATATVIAGHLAQIKPFLNDNKDVIAGMATSWVGPWGEFWKSSNNNIGDNYDITPNTRIIYDAILDSLPVERSFLARYMRIKQQFFGDAAMTYSEGFNGSDKSRIGHQDDSFVADPSDGGTYIGDRALEDAYLFEDTKYTPNIAETEYFDGGVTGQCPNTLRMLDLTRMSSVNMEYNEATLDIWKNQGCYDEIAKNLGYRFVLSNSQTPTTVNSGSNLNLKLTLQNKGYASPFNGRNLEIVMRNKIGGQEYKYDVTSQSDPRRWLPDLGQFTVDLNTTVNAPAGNYDIFVNLPDPMPSIKTRPEYSIQLANVGTWEENTGYNRLNQSVTVQNATTSSSSTSTVSSITSSVQSSTPSSSISSTNTTQPTTITTANIGVSSCNGGSGVLGSGPISCSFPLTGNASGQYVLPSTGLAMGLYYGSDPDVLDNWSSGYSDFCSVSGSTMTCNNLTLAVHEPGSTTPNTGVHNIGVFVSAGPTLVGAKGTFTILPVGSTVSSSSIVVASSSVVTVSSSSSIASASSTTSTSTAVSSSSVASSSPSSSNSSTTSISSTTTSSSVISTTQPALNLKVNLGATFDNSTDAMRTNLRAAGIIPLSQPYNDSRFGYTGGESLPTGDLAIDIVDWVLVEIRDNATNAIIRTKAAILKGSGMIVESTNAGFGNTTAVISLDNLPTGSYKVVLRHRNHIAIATDIPVEFANNYTTNVDFTTNLNVKNSNQSILGTNNSTGAIIYGMKLGNSTGDGSVDSLDRATVRNALETINEYNPNDINMDGSFDSLDRTMMRLAGEGVENLY
jgi:Domain of unknown function (DUF4832)/Domain of unknown function (DUF4874)